MYVDEMEKKQFLLFILLYKVPGKLENFNRWLPTAAVKKT
jgi:hypothetical protein